MPVVLEPELPTAIDVFPCEDGHAQEPSLCESVFQTVKADELWIASQYVYPRVSLGYIYSLF